jgi:hypothetical protein
MIWPIYCFVEAAKELRKSEDPAVREIIGYATLLRALAILMRRFLTAFLIVEFRLPEAGETFMGRMRLLLYRVIVRYIHVCRGFLCTIIGPGIALAREQHVNWKGAIAFVRWHYGEGMVPWNMLVLGDEKDLRERELKAVKTAMYEAVKGLCDEESALQMVLRGFPKTAAALDELAGALPKLAQCALDPSALGAFEEQFARLLESM